MLRDTTSRGLYVRVWPPHTSERRGGGGGCHGEQEGWQGGEGRARMSGQEEPGLVNFFDQIYLVNCF